MAYQTFRCDYCRFTDDNIENVLDHENECSWNPDNKMCNTCGNAIFGPPDGEGMCKIEINFEDEINKEDSILDYTWSSKKNCPFWKPITKR